MNVIIYKQDDGVVAIIRPHPVALETYGIAAIAKKDVPEGIRFWIVDSENIPIDRSKRLAWELDESALGEPHGVGSSSSDFTALLTPNEPNTNEVVS